MEAGPDSDGGAARLPLSVFVIARDEAVRLPRCLASVAFADQVVVVDSGSTDGTPDLARAAGAEVHHRDWTGYGPQKAHAESLCRHPWMLNLDADEVASPALVAEIAALFAGGPPAPGAFRLRILTVYPGDAAPRPFADDYRVVRFYHRDAGRYRDHPLFDRVELAAGQRAGQLAGAVLHHPFLSWAHFVTKENRYTSYQAEAAAPRPPWVLMLRLPVELPVQFLKFYLVRRHLTGGWKGFFFALAAAFARTLRLAKMLERSGAGAPRDNDTWMNGGA